MMSLFLNNRQSIDIAFLCCENRAIQYSSVPKLRNTFHQSNVENDEMCQLYKFEASNSSVIYDAVIMCIHVLVRSAEQSSSNYFSPTFQNECGYEVDMLFNFYLNMYIFTEFNRILHQIHIRNVC